MELEHLEGLIAEGGDLRTIYCIDYGSMAGDYKFFNSSNERDVSLLKYSVDSHAAFFDMDVPADVACEYFALDNLIYNAAFKKLYKVGLRFCRQVKIENTNAYKVVPSPNALMNEDIQF
ncbi:hypothetical protein HA052_04350 [Chromobacterium haemolyticum]|uniref:Uncharacterized protein n=1 Tax=Chromobacterium fluminis TaxID=3044269 RepID=A0ABX0L505_9NEIS|nr:hypothetical protein [Chromobacterium haemolyticum]NHR04421.1 hypothetical protein [Chromobacterium haemolyticum]